MDCSPPPHLREPFGVGRPARQAAREDRNRRNEGDDGRAGPEGGARTAARQRRRGGNVGHIRTFLIPYAGSNPKVWKCPEQPLKPPRSAESLMRSCATTRRMILSRLLVRSSAAHGRTATWPTWAGAGGRFGRLPVIVYDRNGPVDPRARARHFAEVAVE